MSLKILKNKGVPFNNGILMFDYYLQLDQNTLFNFKVYQDKNTNKIKYISNVNNIIYKTDDNYLNIYNISFDSLSNFSNLINKSFNLSSEYLMKINLLFVNLVIDYIKNKELSLQQTMYINLYHFLNNSINNNITISQNDIIIPFIESKNTVNSKYKYTPILLSETGRGVFTDWDFLKELYKLDGFDLFEKYRNSLQDFNTFFDIDLDSFNFNSTTALKNSYNTNKFIYSANLDDSFNRVIEANYTNFIKFYNNDNIISNTSNINIGNDIKIVFNLEYPNTNDNYIFNSFDFEYTILDNVFNKLDEHFEIILEINIDNITLNIKNLKETYYQEELYLTLDTFNIYYTKNEELIKVSIIDKDIKDTNINITLTNKLNTQDDVEYIILQPEDLKIIECSYDERVNTNNISNNSTAYLSFDILGCDIKLNVIDSINYTINTIPLTTFFDTTSIEIVDYYNGKEIELSLLNNLDNGSDGTIYDKDTINSNFYINTNLVLFLNYPNNKNKFSTDINFIGSSSNKLRVFVVNNTTLFFDTEIIEYPKTNLYGFLLPCGISYNITNNTTNRKYYVGYNRKTGQFEQFESYDDIATLNKAWCYEDEINVSDITLSELVTQLDFKLVENFNSTLWNDFYLLYKDKKLNNINMN